MRVCEARRANLIPSDVALAEQNIESATGTLGENSRTFQYTMKYWTPQA